MTSSNDNFRSDPDPIGRLERQLRREFLGAQADAQLAEKVGRYVSRVNRFASVVYAFLLADTVDVLEYMPRFEEREALLSFEGLRLKQDHNVPPKNLLDARCLLSFISKEVHERAASPSGRTTIQHFEREMDPSKWSPKLGAQYISQLENTLSGDSFSLPDHPLEETLSILSPSTRPSAEKGYIFFNRYVDALRFRRLDDVAIYFFGIAHIRDVFGQHALREEMSPDSFESLLLHEYYVRLGDEVVEVTRQTINRGHISAETLAQYGISLD